MCFFWRLRWYLGRADALFSLPTKLPSPLSPDSILKSFG